MADPALGTKQICPNCTAKFYDLGKRPAHCPRCAFEFDPEEAIRTRRSRVRTTAPDYEDTDEEAEDQVKAKVQAEDEDEEPEVITPEIDEVVVDDTLLVDEDEDLDPADPARVGAGADAVDMDIEDADLVDDADDDDVPFLEDDDDADFDEEIDGLPGADDEDR
ncbi:hypothetical protein ABI_02230 [Asticcacaulis biprosthecium C19]|uniref:TIGR02300 family protein n=1 Tax=Asticcacaulis biprosthecium C19 TaxID=715226 RepID=F4QIN2_9CAUL|nr:TIGR02300 family protein [Asticcacaulis biprosthecium]EGF91791.1 hypothetical protein ABI_02230 [Asticcacaulis biprosthecium C19]